MAVLYICGFSGDLPVIPCSDENIGHFERRNAYPFKFLRIEGGEPSADGRGSAPPELAKQQAQAGSDAAPATPPPLGAQSTFIPLHRWGGGVKVLLRYFLTRK